jgi:hypothetical protein
MASTRWDTRSNDLAFVAYREKGDDITKSDDGHAEDDAVDWLSLTILLAIEVNDRASSVRLRSTTRP